MADILASIGFITLGYIIGRTDLMKKVKKDIEDHKS